MALFSPTAWMMKGGSGEVSDTGLSEEQFMKGANILYAKLDNRQFYRSSLKFSFLFQEYIVPSNFPISINQVNLKRVNIYYIVNYKGKWTNRISINATADFSISNKNHSYIIPSNKISPSILQGLTESSEIYFCFKDISSNTVFCVSGKEPDWRFHINL